MPIVQSKFHTSCLPALSNEAALYHLRVPIIVVQIKDYLARIVGYDAMRDYCISGTFSTDEKCELKENQIIGTMNLCTGDISFVSGISGFFHGVIQSAPHALATERKEPRAMGERRGTKGIPCRQRAPGKKTVKRTAEVVEELDSED